MTEINIIKNGDNVREYNFQALEEEDEEEVAELLIKQMDRTILALHNIGAIKAENPPSMEE